MAAWGGARAGLKLYKPPVCGCCDRFWAPVENCGTPRSCVPELAGREETGGVSPGPSDIRFPGWEKTRGQLFMPGTAVEEPRVEERRQRVSDGVSWMHPRMAPGGMECQRLCGLETL